MLEVDYDLSWLAGGFLTFIRSMKSSQSTSIYEFVLSGTSYGGDGDCILSMDIAYEDFSIVISLLFLV